MGAFHAHRKCTLNLLASRQGVQAKRNPRETGLQAHISPAVATTPSELHQDARAQGSLGCIVTVRSTANNLAARTACKSQ